MSDWPIDVVPQEADRLRNALTEGRLVTMPAGLTGVVDAGEGVTVLERRGQRCVFHDAHPAGGCGIQRTLGHASLPLACRQFPRQSVRDPRGVAVTLSHYCPTARAMLDRSDAPTEIVEGGSRFPSYGEYVGLDADPDVPPMLHERCLFDWDSWWLFEATAVALLTERPASGLARLALAVEAIREWRPSAGPLNEAVRRACDMARATRVADVEPTPSVIAARLEDIRLAIPQEWRSAADAALSTRASSPVRGDLAGRFTAAHAFGNWTAYTGRGVRTWYRSIEAAACLLWLTGDPGAVDLTIRHLADTSALTARWHLAELRPVTRRP